MRAIKFRGRDNNASWHKGDLEYQPCTQMARIHVYNKRGQYKGQHIVDQETVGQYTGFTDARGQEIFEGDLMIVTVFDCFDNDKQYIVSIEWIGSEFMGFLNECTAWNLWWLLEQDCEAEILGNIYDNPDIKPREEK